MLGRSPDHVASCISGMYMGLDLFERHSPRRAPRRPRLLRVRAGQRPLSHLCDHQPPSRSQQGRRRAVGRIPRRRRLRRGLGGHHDPRRENARHRLPDGQRSVRRVHPAAEARRGKAQLHGRSYRSMPKDCGFSRASRIEAQATSKFDNPLSSSYDENDAVLYFDDVKVPWDRVLVHNDVQMAQANGTRFRPTSTRTISARSV